MKKKFTKQDDFKVDPNKSKNAKCTCIDKGKLSSTCSRDGICPTLKAIGPIKGFKYKDKRGVRKEFKGLGKGIEAFRKIFESMRKKI